MGGLTFSGVTRYMREWRQRQTVMQYRKMYTSLDHKKKEIRLLKVAKKTGDMTGNPRDPDIIDCRLEVASLSTDEAKPLPAFKAISWCWGSQDTKRGGVYVNGEEVNVPVNAFKLLRWLAASSYNQDEDAAFWLDILCIDQANVVERNESVKLMQDIYSRADKVIICLNLDDGGNVGYDAKTSIEAIVKQCRDITGGEEQSDLERTIYTEMASQNIMLQSDEPLPASCNWSALLQFFASEWFTRVWVIQEVVLARRADCIFGQQVVDWNHVSLACKWMQHRRYFKNLRRHPGTIGIDNTSIIRDASNQTRELHSMLTAGAVFRSTDPRDQVYGLLGLIPSAIAVSLAPDYEKSVRDVYTQATKAAIMEQQALGLLTLANTQDSPVGQRQLDEGFPTWVPRYDFVFIRHQNSVRRTSVAVETAADNRLLMRCRWPVSSPDTLVVDGLLVGNIDYVSPRLTEELLRRDRLFLFETLHLIWQHTKQAAEIRNMPRADQELGLSKVLTLGPSQLSLAPEEIERVRINFSSFRTFYGLTWSTDPETTEGEGEDLEMTEERLIAAEDYLYSVWLSSVNRIFFTTDTGYIGMGPRDLTIGDRLCIILGSRVPLVLRPVDGYYAFQGDAYVNGVMKGDHVRDLQQRDMLESELQTFHIL